MGCRCQQLLIMRRVTEYWRARSVPKSCPKNARLSQTDVRFTQEVTGYKYPFIHFLLLGALAGSLLFSCALGKAGGAGGSRWGLDTLYSVPVLTACWFVGSCLISSLGVSFITLCEESYPTVLAFCFLDELQREFISSYDARKVKNVSRPYALIEFNLILQKIKQRYNNTRSLKPRTNLTDMSQEVKLRPPHRLSLSDVNIEESNTSLVNDSVFAHDYKPLHGNKHPTLGYFDKAIMVFCSLWFIYHFVRFGAIASSGPVLFQHEQRDEILTAASAFFGACVASFLQIRFICTTSRLRFLKAVLSGMLITLCCMVLSMDGWLDDIFAYGHIGSCWLAALAVLCQRKSDKKLPNYTV